MEKRLRLRSFDGHVFEIQNAAEVKYILEHVDVIGIIIQDLGYEDYIPLPRCSAKVLAVILDYVKLSVSSAAAAAAPTKLIDELSKADLIDVVTAAHYLQYKQLTDACCSRIAQTMENKTAEEIRAEWNIYNDFSSDEEEMVTQENKWIKVSSAEE